MADDRLWLTHDDGEVMIQIMPTKGRIPPTVILTEVEACALRDWLCAEFPKEARRA